VSSCRVGTLRSRLPGGFDAGTEMFRPRLPGGSSGAMQEKLPHSRPTTRVSARLASSPHGKLSGDGSALGFRAAFDPRLADPPMSPAPVCPRVTLTIEVSTVLFDALVVSADMSGTTVNAFVALALRRTQISFFAETSAADSESPSDSDVALLDVRAAAPRRRGDLGTLQQAILDHLVGSPTGIYDLRAVRRTLNAHSRPALSVAVHRLVERGVLDPMIPTGGGFQRDVGGTENRVRYVRRGVGR